ncbi:MAG: IclR family transcriptional regulator [Euryarchaeota archaeon]|nr:IclR family transcriptional regulator [Euryarchaeota archaeon]
MPDTSERNRVRTTRTAFEILRWIRDKDGIGVSELARDLGIAKSTAHRHLTTLLDEECIIKEGEKYYLGLQFLNFGEAARNRHPAYRMAGRKVEQLAAETQERVQFIVEEHGHAVYVYREVGERAVQTDPGIGKRIPLHATAAGKAILASFPQERIEAIIERRGLDALTEATITRPDALFDELEEIRSRGYGFNEQENIVGLHAVGVPIRGADETVIGALSISGPSHRLVGETLTEKLPRLLLGTANELELNIAHS